MPMMFLSRQQFQMTPLQQTIWSVRILSMMPAKINRNLKIMSYNMHGFRQGLPVVEDIINMHSSDVLLLQEHWLTPLQLI